MDKKQEKQNGWHVLRYYFKKLFHFDFKKLTVTGLIMVIVLRLGLIFLLGSGVVNYLIPQYKETPLAGANQTSIIHQAFQENNEMLSRGGADRYVFINEWLAHDKKSFNVETDLSVSLNEGYVSARFDYDGEVPTRNNLGFSFASEGVFGPNVIIGRPEFWEMTVGDKDDSVITLKATNKIGGLLEPIEEVNWKKLRPESNSRRPRTEDCHFVPGEEIKVEISENYLTDTKQYKVDVTVTCNDMSSDTLSWLFIPPPKWTELENIYLALIDLDGENQTKIHFINPSIIELLNISSIQ